MKKVKSKAIRKKYIFRGFTFGLGILLFTALLSLNSDVFSKDNTSVLDAFRLMPGLWLVVFLPFITAIAGYYTANSISETLKKATRKIKKEAKRSQLVLEFIDNLRKGNLETAVPLSSKKDELGRSLVRLKEYMIKNKREEEQRRIEEEQRTWVTNGLAQFGELLRKTNNDLEELSFSIIRYIVDYLKINQAGFFLLNQPEEGEPYFEQKACIAYDRKKYADKIIKWEEGLIGRCALEKETIYLTDVPNDYMNITSGLGEANASAVLIVPLKVNDKVYGVIELASFSEFQKFEIEFIEKIAESIASTISAVQINIQTNKLLKETQEQAEKMAQQEEELRQNLEEMQATQEESDRRELEMKGILEAIDHSAISSEFETDGTLISVNHNFLDAFKYNIEEVENQNIRIFFFKDDLDELNKILADLRNGKNFKGRVRRRTKMGDAIYLLTTYTPVMDNEGNIVKILSLDYDITEQVKMEEELKKSKEELGIMLEQARNEVKEQFKEIEAVKIRNEKTLEGALDAILTTNKDGIIEFFNLAAEKLFGYDRQEVLGKQVALLFSKDTAKNDEFVSAFVNPEKEKIVGERREVPILTKFGEEIPVLFLLSEAKVGDDHSFTAFIQNVEVELF
ncbi:MAG: PAS domain S-box protein [Chlorobi bacterium]|nr:PAS domain S-box protein [Chlorobiota bacterium]